GDAMEIDEGEEVDGAELRIDGGGTAEAAGDVEIGAKEAGCARRGHEFAGLFATGGRVRLGSQGGLDEILVSQGVVEGYSLVFVLRRQGAAADQITGVAEGGVGGDAFPEQEQGSGVAIVLVDAGAT